MKHSKKTSIIAGSLFVALLFAGCTNTPDAPQPTLTAPVGVSPDLGSGIQGDAPKNDSKPLERNTAIIMPTLDVTTVKLNEKVTMTVMDIPKDIPYKLGLEYKGESAKKSFITLEGKGTTYTDNAMTTDVVIPENLNPGKYLLSVEIVTSPPDVSNNKYQTAIYDAPIEVEK